LIPGAELLIGHKMTSLHPSVTWAQRNNCVFLTVCLEDCHDPTIKLEPDSVYFKGVGGPNKKEYEAKIDLFEAIKPENSAYQVRDRNIEFCLKKETEGPYWPRLTKSKDKKHWLKIDFNKWKDEDESEDEGAGGPPGGMGGPGFGGGDTNFEEMMRQMGGMGGFGAGGEKPSMDDLNGGETDSDDDNDLPDLE